MWPLALLISLSILLSSCLLGPNYRPPETCLVPDFEGEPCITEEIKTREDPSCAWWKVFNDPFLEKYILLSAAHNNTVKAAEANILEARALRQVTASRLYPHFNADFNALRVALSKNGLLGLFGERLRPPHHIFNLFNAFIDASWEIDVFGKIRRGVEAADANTCAQVEHRNDILISILAETAVNYFEIRSAQTRAHLIEENIALLEKTAHVVREQFQKGLRNGLDFQKIEAEVATYKSTLPDVYASMYNSMYALSILTGNLPEDFVCELLCGAPLPIPPAQVAVGIRSDLLRRRPDVRFAERKLAEATANTGVAVASFFPSVNIFGLIGFDSLRFNNLFQSRSKTWLIDGDISFPLFHAGQLTGTLKAREAQTAEACFNYQQSVLKALSEAESAITNYAEELATTALLHEAVARNENIVNISNQRFVKGIANVIEWLDSERALNTSRQNLLTSHTSSLLDLIALYKALGGGWECALQERCFAPDP